MKTTIHKTLSETRTAEAMQYKNMTVVPLFSPPSQAVDYYSLKEAMEMKLVSVSEVSEGGNVPELKVHYSGNKPLLLIDGEELEGAKQNRIVNVTMLLAAASAAAANIKSAPKTFTEYLIPVSCTEQGRWSYNKQKHFSDSDYLMAAKARYKNSRRVKKSLSTSDGYQFNQSEVWSDIEEYHGSYKTNSRTRAMKDVFDAKKNDFQAYQDAFPLQDGQTGLAVFVGEKLAGVEMVSLASAYQHLHIKFIKSYVIEAMKEEGQTEQGIVNQRADIDLFLTKWDKAEYSEHQPIGLGMDCRLEQDYVEATALVYDNVPVHFSANVLDFVEENEGGGNKGQEGSRRYRNFDQTRNQEVIQETAERAKDTLGEMSKVIAQPKIVNALSSLRNWLVKK